jgi:competence protein ComEA
VKEDQKMQNNHWKGVARRSALATLIVMVLGAVAAAGEARADEPARASEGVVNLNTATADQLGLLPGIGETKARAIVAYRTRRPFARVDDIVAVRGIGRATLRQLRPYLAVRGETTLSHAVTARSTPPASAPPQTRTPPRSTSRR